MKRVSLTLLSLASAAAVVFAPRASQAGLLGGAISVQGGYATAFPLGDGSAGIHGGGIVGEAGLMIGNHFLGLRGVYQRLYRLHYSSAQNAVAAGAKYSYTWSLLGDRLTVTPGFGMGLGFYDGCVRGDSCGGGGLEVNLAIGVGYRVLSWLGIELINDLRFQTGMENGVDTLMIYSPMIALRAVFGQ